MSNPSAMSVLTGQRRPLWFDLGGSLRALNHLVPPFVNDYSVGGLAAPKPSFSFLFFSGRCVLRSSQCYKQDIEVSLPI